MTAPDSISMGSTIGNYRLGRMVGRGGFGRVYEAEDSSTGQRVAVKTIHANPNTEEGRRLLARFEREIDAVRRVKHPGIIQTFHGGQLKQGEHVVAYYAMEFVEGRTLLKLVE